MGSLRLLWKASPETKTLGGGRELSALPRTK